ncbi:MAG: 3-oxoadipate enol-lactonase 2 [Marmoricola sp.]|nr:3-oxoadipate enol-lactonase 2 [Marmoricola sp.]
MTGLLFLHPLGADHTFWQPVVDLLPDVAWESIDLPGHGSAPLPESGSTIADLARTVAGHITGTDGGPRTVVGLSLGGLVALELAASHPELVEHLVVADSVAVYPDAMIAMWHQRAATARSGDLHELVGPMVDMWFTAGLAEADDPRVLQARKVFASTPAEGYARSCEALAGADLTEAVRSGIKVPTTVVCGTEDLPPFVESARWLARTIPQAELRWIEGAKHASASERPTEFVAILRDLVS